jgi:hypothetical protein
MDVAEYGVDAALVYSYQTAYNAPATIGRVVESLTTLRRAAKPVSMKSTR